MRGALLWTALLAACATAPRPVATTRRLGDAMDEAGRRFQRSERAAIAGRWELAKYDLHELEEIFTEDLASSSWHGKPQLADLARTFQSQQLAALRSAVDARDHAAFEHAVADTARACNACHKAADQNYIEISERLGADVPVLDARAIGANDNR
jgi:hypothetical protein